MPSAFKTLTAAVSAIALVTGSPGPAMAQQEGAAAGTSPYGTIRVIPKEAGPLSQDQQAQLAAAAEAGEQALLDTVAQMVRDTPDQAADIRAAATRLKPGLKSEIDSRIAEATRAPDAWRAEALAVGGVGVLAAGALGVGLALGGGGGGGGDDDDGGDGDGGGGLIPSPPPPPPPPPPPEDPGEPEDFVTQEFNNQPGLGQINAQFAYSRLPDADRDTVGGSVSGGGSAPGGGPAVGSTGDKIVVAVMDSGIDFNQPDLDDRIDPRGRDFIDDDQDPQDTGGHGTNVSGIIAAEKGNDGGDPADNIHGVAFDADILPMRVFGTISAASNGEFNEALALSAEFGADVVNNSWSFVFDDDGDPLTAPVTRTLADVDAASAEAIAGDMFPGLRALLDVNSILVWANGNSGRAEPSFIAGLPTLFDELDDFTAADQELWVAVAAVDENNNIADFSERCGSAADFCLAAPGTKGAFATTQLGGGTTDEIAGTSFAAPHVTGAIAILLQHFPSLSPQEALEILFQTAKDIGPAEETGQGLIDLDAATQPVGQTGVPAGAKVDGPRFDLAQTSLAGSPAFGDGMAAALDGSHLLMLDSFDRAFAAPLSSVVAAPVAPPALTAARLDRFGARAPAARRVGGGGWISSSYRQAEPESPGVSGARTASDRELDRLAFTTELGGASRAALHYDTEVARNFAALADPAALTETGAGPGAGAPGRGRGDELAMGTAFAHPYLGLTGEGYGAITELPGTALGLGSDSRLAVGAFRSGDGPDGIADGAATGVATRLAFAPLDGLTARIEAGGVQERGALLGATGEGALEIGDGATGYAGLALDVTLGPETRLGGYYYAGMSRAQAGGLFDSLSGVRSEAFGLRLAHDGWLAEADRLTLAVAQPLRVAEGEAALTLPVGRQADGSIERRRLTTDLTPSGREIDLEAGWALPLAPGRELILSAAWRHEPGHRADAPYEALGIARLNWQF